MYRVPFFLLKMAIKKDTRMDVLFLLRVGNVPFSRFFPDRP